MDLKKLIRSALRLTAIFMSLSVASQSQTGQTYYISTGGSDSNPGTQQSPWENLSVAISKAGPGDTILMRGGNYVTNEVWIRGDRGMGGANGQYLTIKNFPGEIVSVGGDRRIIVDDAPFMRIEGLSFRLPYNISGGGEGFQVLNNTFEGSQPRYGAVEFFANNGLIEGNTIMITGGGDTQDHGIYLHAGHDNVLRNNFISGTSGYGIHVYDAVSSGGPPAAAGYNSILIEGNVIIGSRLRAGIIISPDGIEAQNIRILKNTIANHAINGIRIANNTHNVQIYNNTLVGNGSGANHPDDKSAVSMRNQLIHDIFFGNNIIVISDGGAFHIQNREGSAGIVAERNLYYGAGEPKLSNLADTKSLYGDPLFVNPINNDYKLQTFSPAIDKGLDIGLPYNGTAPDLGAYESGNSTSIDETGNQPRQFELHQNYPNPFNPTTRIAYDLSASAVVTLKIFNVTGAQIRNIVLGEQAAGSHTVEWDGRNTKGNRVASGVYFYRLSVANGLSSGVDGETKKMILMQ